LDISGTSFLISYGHDKLDAFRALAESTTLKALIMCDREDFRDSAIDDKVAKILAASTSLIYLNITGSSVGPKGAKALRNNISLISLNICSNPLGDKGIKYLSLNNHLKYLNVCDTQFGLKGINYLVENNSSIVSLCISNNNIGDDGINELLRHKSIKKLSCRNIRLSEKGKQLLKNSSFEELINSTDLVWHIQLDGGINELGEEKVSEDDEDDGEAMFGDIKNAAKTK